ncbi:MAG: hypothetical protein AAF570_02340, partial [Bacteroidota bacterium]
MGLLGLFCVWMSGAVMGQKKKGKVMTGTWMGRLTQQESPPFDEYRYRMELKQSGNFVSGTTHISVNDNPDLYAKMSIR